MGLVFLTHEKRETRPHFGALVTVDQEDSWMVLK